VGETGYSKESSSSTLTLSWMNGLRSSILEFAHSALVGMEEILGGGTGSVSDSSEEESEMDSCRNALLALLLLAEECRCM
jgi:hypothetical protein